MTAYLKMAQKNADDLERGILLGEAIEFLTSVRDDGASNESILTVPGLMNGWNSFKSLRVIMDPPQKDSP